MDITNDIVILDSQNKETLARWWCELNNWGWPEALPPEDTNEHGRIDGRRSYIMGWIVEKVGIDECLSRHRHP